MVMYNFAKKSGGGGLAHGYDAFVMLIKANQSNKGRCGYLRTHLVVRRPIGSKKFNIYSAILVFLRFLCFHHDPGFQK